MENNPEDPNSAESLQNAINVLLPGALARIAAEMQIQREVLCTLLAKEPSILQGKEPADYIESKIQERLNSLLAGAADVAPDAASALANMLLPRKKPPED